MKVLVLGNSNDTGAWVNPEDKRHVEMGARLSAEFDVPVEIVARNAWPNERMLSFVSRWMDEESPDLVFLNVTTFPFSYESTPLRVKRVFGRLGEPIGDAGMRLAESKRWSHNAVFRTLRRWAQATIGGDTHFTPEEAAQRYGELIRLLVQREGTVVAVKGPFGRTKKGITRREAVRHERRRQAVHRKLKALCDQLHVPYEGADEPRWKVRPQPKGLTAGDGSHSNAAGHAYTANDHYAILRRVWAAHFAEHTRETG